MADQVSTLLQLVLQETGNNNNNWGVILNQTLMRLEEAVTGQSVITVTAGTKALTDDEQRAGILMVMGNLTADAIIEVKPHLKNWIVYNGTTGEFSLSIRTPNNPLYQLARDVSELVWCDGVSIFPVGEHGKVPVGSMVWSFRTVGGPVEPCFVEANGQAISRSRYRRLYDRFGTVHGGGDGSTTFNVPDMTGRYVRARGGNAGNVIGAKQDDMVKAHTHTATASTDGEHRHGLGDGATRLTGATSGSIYRTAGAGTDSNTSYAGSHTHTITVDANEGVENRPLTIVAVPLIRFQ